ncbi:SUPPRESSOR OF ABI3-5-like isoform X2 [Lolium rigidum]|uniref:SUPPRESSOR OF ABI3-5-like isoform X2 n=1 Tax=Lolium rigidum TaxID=89674 RepID=UPI001F5C1DFA|nr:SUPPRESSOR OF ABI3-5-like isoform X2 [Lolium rigidum]
MLLLQDTPKSIYAPKFERSDREMDRGRYGPHHGWENNSAPDGYGVINEPDFRAGGSYSGRRYVDDGFPSDRRGAFGQDIHDRNMYPPPPSGGTVWSQPRRNFDEEFVTAKDYRRNKRIGSRDRGEFGAEFEDRYQSREDSFERDHQYSRHRCDSDYEKGRRESSWRRHDLLEHERERKGLSHERDGSPYARHSRSRSCGRDNRSRSRSRSRSPRGKSHSRSQRDGFYDDNHFDRRTEQEWDERRHNDIVAPSATVVLKGLSQKTNEDDLYQILAEWGPLRSVRVIKERPSGLSRGFAFIDFPTVEAARKMMESTGDNGLLIDGRQIFFEYSKPTGGDSLEHVARPAYGRRSISAPCDWICTICGCMNFARRISCFQCNEPRTDDAPPADAASSTKPFGKRGSELGPTHVLVVRGLEENADEEMLRYEFAKHAPIKDIRLVRDKFTHVSRGFAFVHFHSVVDATKALEATNGIKHEKNGQVLRVAYAKSAHGTVSGSSQSSNLAAAAIEAASFAQQYDAVGWAPKEYNAEDKPNSNTESQKDDSTPQSGFVWDEKSGYYFDSSSGFYYDGNTGLYYDSNVGVWYSYDQKSQQYVPCNESNNSKTTGDTVNESVKIPESNSGKKMVISAPAATVKLSEKTSLPEAVQAAANAALAAEKKEKEKAKEIKLASKISLLANKKKMNNVLAMWKQRNQEGQAANSAFDDKESTRSVADKLNSSASGIGFSLKPKPKSDAGNSRDMNLVAGYNSLGRGSGGSQVLDSDIKPRPVSNSLGTTIMGVIRGSGRGAIKSDTTFHVSSDGGSNYSTNISTSTTEIMTNAEMHTTSAPFKTDLSSLGSYSSSGVSGSAKRRFSEAPGQSQYRDRAAERRSLYGLSSSLPNGDGLDTTGDYLSRKGSSEMGSMPFPPGVGERSIGEIEKTENYEVITADRAIDENNVGNRILRNMGWQEGLGLGKNGSGIKEPVQAKSGDVRAGLGSQQKKAADPSLEAQAGDSYKTIIQKKAIARFREMS